MGPTGPGPGYRASTARSSHCNTQGITFLKPRLEWVHGGVRIRGPQGPGPVFKAKETSIPEKPPPNHQVFGNFNNSLVSSRRESNRNTKIKNHRVTIVFTPKNLWGGFFLNDWNAVVMAGQYPVCHFEASQTARRFQSCNLFSFPRWMDGKNAVTIFIIDI